MSKNWCNVHNHTVFSMLDGHSNVKSYARRAKELNMPAATITDHGNLHGWLDFYDACKKEGVKPILGLEAYQARKSRFDRDDEERAGPATNEWDQRGPYHLTILARNLTGYKNLIKLSSRAYLEGYYVKPRMDLELLADHADGLIVLSGCLNGELQQALLREDFNAALDAAGRMQAIVGRENYFIEIQDHHLEEQKKVKDATLHIARILKAKVIPTGDCHYTHQHDAAAHDAMLCISTGTTMENEKRFKFNGDNFYLKSYDEMAGLFEPEWLCNSLDLADMIDVDLKFGEFYFPQFPLPKGETSKDEYLEKQVWTGIRERYGEPIPEEIRERTNYELGVVKRMGFGDYFLVVSDLVRWAKTQGIRVGWGRGSAAGSILSFALRITNLDPIKFGLMFERFLVEGRKSMPDIDLDFDDRYRDKVIGYARDKYGDDHVAHIATFSQVGAKSAIRDAARVLGADYLSGDKLAKLVPMPILGVQKTLTQAMATPEMMKAYETDKEAKHILDIAKGLEGVYRQPGIHAAGVVVSQAPTMEFVPLMVGGKNKDIVVTQWDMNRVEQCGQLKIDFLGLRNLGVIDMCLANIAITENVDLDVDDIPLDDKATYDELKRGNAMGVFQLESGGMKKMMMSLQPSDINDVMALISLFRPGPLGSGMDKMFIDRKHGREKITYPHPVLKDVLEPSYGVMLYQEDVLNVTKLLAGFTIGEADDLRKVLGKKLMDKIEDFRSMFVDGCVTNNGVDKRLANKIYDDIVYFGGYGFNRAHAASYAMVSYVTAYLKTHYPSQYMAALLSSVTDNKDKLAQYLNECRRMGITVLGPSIARSERDFMVQSETELLFGLGAVDGVGPAIVTAILNNREDSYTSLLDYLRKCDPSLLNKRTIEHLSSAGAFDELLSERYRRIVNRAQKLQLLEMEKEVLGIYVTDHPLLDVWDFLSDKVTHSIADFDILSSGTTVRLGGIITSVTKRTTKRGDKMYNLEVQDLHGSTEIVVFPHAARNTPDDYFNSGDIGILEGNLSIEGDDEFQTYQVFYSKFEKLDAAHIKGSRPIMLTGTTKLSQDQIKRLCGIIKNVNGDSIVYFTYPEGKHMITLKFTESTSIEVEESLKQIVSISSLENSI